MHDAGIAQSILMFPVMNVGNADDAGQLRRCVPNLCSRREGGREGGRDNQVGGTYVAPPK
jgi:hypothetical protein